MKLYSFIKKRKKMKFQKDDGKDPFLYNNGETAW